MYKLLLRSFLFLLQAEIAHYFTFSLLKFSFRLPLIKFFLKKLYQFNDIRLSKEIAGLHFPNPVGLAAGFDKNAIAIDELAVLGFGFIEIGTLTPRPQAGNPKPRLFRLLPDKAIINRMGFNNEGVETAIIHLQKRKSNILVGGNIGKNKDTPNEKATEDYLYCFEKLFDYVDYFVVNVSSPNTPNLRALQEKEPLEALLQALQKENLKKTKSKPIFLKIAPDLNESQLDDIIEIVKNTEIAGIIATNTTLSRKGLKSNEKLCKELGGLSGKPLQKRSTEVIRYLYEKSKGSFPIIGVGGITSPQDAYEKLQAGASLVQVYTGLVYEGPALVKKINKFLAKMAF
ncbi:MAG: quinone-dependent dihydroorotate dehydrogenase [Raineya sp.]